MNTTFSFLNKRCRQLYIIAVIMMALLISNCSARRPLSHICYPSICPVFPHVTRPLIVDWHSADHVMLNSLLRKTAIVARYEKNCGLEIISECYVTSTEKASTGYAYESVLTKQNHVSIINRQELYEYLPLHALKLEGQLQMNSLLSIDMTIVGRYELTTPVHTLRPEASTRQKCSDATHVIKSIAVGYFKFYAGDDNSKPKQLLNVGGDPKACEQATLEDTKPPAHCDAFIRVELIPLNKGHKWFELDSSQNNAQ